MGAEWNEISTKREKRTCTLAVHKDVMLPILEPDTPGGLRASMDWRIFSSSATADDIADELLRENEVAKREIETKREKKFWPRPIERRDDSSYCGKSLEKQIF